MHLDHDNCMEVTVLKGRGSDVQDFANSIIAERGVRHGHVVYLPADGVHDHSHGHSHTHSHTHSDTHRHAPTPGPRRSTGRASQVKALRK
jgi:CopG family nickel-responsive transcriptional regulator